ncbi:hypothetical protein [Sphingomonas parapaucimobilis]|uniref:hypothetical protein n=1 Tax=Sphingomonas parapaucimobilis TaxID=28213 RepID=UPI0035C7AD96
MNNDTDAVMQACALAVTRLLLGNRKMKDGVVVTAGTSLDIAGRIRIGETAVLSQTDVVHLEFAADEGGRFGMSGITLFAPRDNGCFIQTDCRLWLSKAGKRGVILPRPELRGYYRLSPRELIHIDGKPAQDPGEGIARASAWIDRFVRRGSAMFNHTDLYHVSVAA